MTLNGLMANSTSAISAVAKHFVTVESITARLNNVNDIPVSFSQFENCRVFGKLVHRVSAFYCINYYIFP